jgi:predicted MFS family arabinose efflux permease
MAAFACFYSPGATAFANVLVPREKRGRALGTIFAGLPLAAVFGLPFGTMVGHAFGWRASFLAVALLAMIGFVALLVVIKPTKPLGVPGLRARLMPLKLATVRYAAIVTVVWAGGIYALFSYMAAYFEEMGIGGDGYAGVLALFGACAFAGNQFGGWSADRLGALPTMRNALFVAIPALLLFALLPALPHAAWAAVVLVAIWSFAIFSFWPARQTQMVAIAPQSMPMLLGLNTSAFHLGVGSGSAIGGIMISHGPVAALGLVAAAIELLALGLIAGEWRAWRTAAA